ncbi:MAG: choice-of-anchor L domain-containing protein, partial [Bacteroidota bacterium]
MMNRLLTFLCIAFCFSPLASQAQLTTADTLTTTQLLQTLFGGGITISNLQVQCDTTLALREFDGSASNLGLNRGVLMSTGEAEDAEPLPPIIACNNLASTGFGGPGYAPLTTIAGTNTMDACVITFDITPLCDTIAIRYIFASEEYPVFVNSINDVFAFFISGPGFGPPPGNNIALVPGTTTPVAINNVNNGTSFNACTPPPGPCTNCAFYVDNATGSSITFNAFTSVLTAEAVVQPCQTYTVTLAIADGVDDILDSGVFLEAGGIGCSSPALTLQAVNSTALGNNIAVEDCVDGLFTFSIPTPLNDTVVFHYTIGGTATPGVDYPVLPDSIVMLPGQTTVTLPVPIFTDNNTEGLETIEIIYVDSNLCATQIYTDTAVLEILDPPNIFSPGDQALCSGDTIPIGVSPLNGQTYSWSPTTGLSDPNVSNPTLTLTNPNPTPLVLEYVLTTVALQGFCEQMDTIQVTVGASITTDFEADTVCFGNFTSFTDLTITDSVTAWTWDFGDNTVSNASNPVHTYQQPGIYTVQLITENSAACPDTAEGLVLVDSLPIVSYLAQPVCLGLTTQFTHIVGPGVSYQWDFGDGNQSSVALPSHTYLAAGTYNSQLTATTAAGCVASNQVDVEVYANPVADFDFTNVCEGFATEFTNLSRPGTSQNLNYNWNFGDGSPASTQENPIHLYAQYGSPN